MPRDAPPGSRPSIEIDLSRNRVALSGRASQHKTHQHAHLDTGVPIEPKLVAVRWYRGSRGRAGGDSRCEVKSHSQRLR